ncbi:MAG: MFS transporter [Cryobacterium sp.]|nr:MFS transporter [Cryobacterium sp.]
MKAMFRSLGVFNYRVWFVGALVSNIGAWMQRTAQDWIVLTELTDHDAAAVGISMALQFGPQLLLVPLTGVIADRVDAKRALVVTQAIMGVLALGLGVIVILGVAELWHVYLFALGIGVVAAIDAPIRQTFVAELVEKRYLGNAVSLNSVSFHLARMIGPAVAGFLVVLLGAGLVFIINATTFGATLLALALVRRAFLHLQPRAGRAKGQVREGFAYVRTQPTIVAIMAMVGVMGALGLNFAINISTMATVEFGKGAGEFGVLTSVMAIGSVTGALLSARREKPRMGIVIWSSALFFVSCAVAAVMPTYELFAVSLVVVGFAVLTFMTNANAFIQTNVNPVMRGRVMALYMAIFVGGTPVGAPFVGWVVNEVGPRWGVGVAAIAGLITTGIGLVWLIRHRELRLRFSRSKRWLHLTYLGDARARELATQEIAVVEAEVQRS